MHFISLHELVDNIKGERERERERERVYEKRRSKKSYNFYIHAKRDFIHKYHKLFVYILLLT
jgi:hypothetical protein